MTGYYLAVVATVCAVLLAACPDQTIRRPEPGTADGSALTGCVSRVTDGGPAELCNGSDETCDGVADEGYPVGEACNGACPNGVAYAGHQVCDGAQRGVVCQPDEPAGDPWARCR